MARDRAKAPLSARGAPEGAYSAAELAAQHQLFGCARECVAAALRFEGVERATLCEARAVVERFLRRRMD